MPAPLTVSLVNSLVVDRDAISNVIRANADVLGRLPGGCKLKIFVQYKSDLRDSRLTHTPDVATLLTNPHFRKSDIVLFHYGIHYDLFPAIQLAPRTAHVAAFYFGVTPPHLIPEAQREIIRDSYRQGSYLAAADTVLVTADSLRADLQLFGVAADKALKIGLPVSFNPKTPTRSSHGPTRFLFVSRFVRPKGVHDLLEGFRRAAEKSDVQLDLVGSMTFSDKQYLAQLRDYVCEHQLGDRVAFHFDIPNSAVADRYAAAHCLVSPSHHEGFGMPIVEALSAGCYIIVSDSYASPETAGNMGLTYRTGDAAALAGRMLEFATARQQNTLPYRGGYVSTGEWGNAAAAYAATFSPAAYAKQFLGAMLNHTKLGIPATAREYGAESCTAYLQGPPHTPAHPQSHLFQKFDALRWDQRAADKA
jgi:glycosyltransferase involved in cell wall biosynthesis